MSVKIKEVITIVKNERYEIVVDGGFHLEYFGQIIKSEESFSVFITSSYKPITDETRVWVTKLNQYQNSIVESRYWTTKQLMDNSTFRHHIFAALQHLNWFVKG